MSTLKSYKSALQALTYSEFINIVSGSDFAVGDDLYSCTKEMNFSRPVPYMMSRDSLEERRVVFIDTPGLADTRMSQEELFHDVTALLVSL
jgi:GTPase Era involved in 16S rRNA processing